MDFPVTHMVWSFSAIRDTASAATTQKHWNADIRKFWQQRKKVILYAHRSDRPCPSGQLTHLKREVKWLTNFCQNLRILDLSFVSLPDTGDIDVLLGQSPRLEMFATSAPGSESLLKSLLKCVNLQVLVIMHNVIDWDTLSCFRSLRGLELGHFMSFLDVASLPMLKIFKGNSNLAMLHLLGSTNSFQGLGDLPALKVQSLSFPYEQEPITLTKVRSLRRFSNLRNLNFGQSSYASVNVIREVSRVLPQLRSFSFFAPPVQAQVLVSEILNGTLFPCLKQLGCRNKNGTYDLLKATSIKVYDYELTRNTQIWCYPVFDIRHLWSSYYGSSKAHLQY